MVPVEVTGIVRAIFVTDDPEIVRDWLDRHVPMQLRVGLGDITFQAGDIGAVFGLRLDDGRRVVLKALRPGARLHRAAAVADCQNRLAAAGFGCPVVLAGPARTDDVAAVIEQDISCRSTGSPHDNATRAVMAAALADQIALLRNVTGQDLVEGRPTWANWHTGAWPPSHDPIFDFTTPVPGFAWLDAAADIAAEVLRDADTHLPPVIGHSDWVWQNVCIRDGQFVTGYDWDSLIYAPEPAIAGLVAGSFTQGSSHPPHGPAPGEITAFLADYQAATRIFDPEELAVATAAATWVRCYNARCHLDNAHRRGMTPPPGAALEQLAAHHASEVIKPARDTK